MSQFDFTRRAFLAASAAAALPLEAKYKKIPVGVEMYSIRDRMRPEQVAESVKIVAKMGYQGLEFYGPYFGWKEDFAKEIRKVMDDAGIRCFSTHNGRQSFLKENWQKAVDLNGILGSEFIVMASAGRVEGIDGWKKVAEDLANSVGPFKKAKMAPGFHNHQTEWRPVNGTRPMDVLAQNTPKDVVLQLDVGTTVEVGEDPVKWINANKGRIRSMHLKEWSKEPGVGYKALFGEGNAPWADIFKAAEKAGGIKYYLIEQEGSRLTSVESIEKCLESFKKFRA